ncbi:MAG: STT3 domain-containing protein [Candidatus Heimdallarchaeota archaeon]
MKREHLLIYASLALILIGAFLLRILPYLETEMLLKGLDPWVQYRCALFLNENGMSAFLNWYDQSTWYPYGRYMGQSMYIIIPMTAVFVYKAALFLGINMTMLAACYFTPAIFGTITVFVIYKLGEVLHSKRTGLFSAFFVSMAIGFMSRSIVGFFDNECVGILLMFLTFYFFVKGLTKDSMMNNVLAGICLGLLTLSWGAFRYAYGFLALYALVMILLKKYSRRLLATFSVTIILGMTIGALIPRTNIAFALSTEQLIPIIMIIGMVVITVYQELKKSISVEKLKKIVQYVTLGVIGTGIIAVIVLYFTGAIDPIADKFLRTIFPTLAESLPLIESVAENHTSAWGTLFFNIYIMTFLLPVGFYFCIKKPNEKTVFLLMLGLTGIYFGGSMVRLSLILTPAAALVAGYTIDEILRPFALISQERFTISRRKRRATKQIGKDLISVAYIFIAIVLMMTSIFGINMINLYYVQNHELTPLLTNPQNGQQFYAHDYQEAYQYISENIAPYSAGEKPPLIMSWWDYGYQLRTLGNATVMVDNATINSTQIGVVGAMLIHNETHSAKLCRQYGVDYVFVLSPGKIGSTGNDIAKSTWMMQISEEHSPDLGIEYKDYFNEDPEEGESYGFTSAFYDSLIYKLCAYKLNADGTYGGDTTAGGVANWRQSMGLDNAPDVNSFDLTQFNLVFQSKFALIRVYEVL